MAKAQGKKAAAQGKTAAKKVVAKVKVAAASTKKKVAAKKPATQPKSLKKKAAAPEPKKPVAKVAAKVKTAAKVVKTAAKKVVEKAKPAAPKAIAKPIAKPVAKPDVKPVAKPTAPKAKAAPAPAVAALIAKAAPAPPPRPVVREAEKKRGRRARPRVQSNGVPVAAWLSTEKPRSASFIPAPPRAEAPSAIAAPPASSDRLIRPEDIGHPAVRTVPVRIDVEQGAGRFYVIANPPEVSVRAGEGIEWDFRYLGGADVTVEEIVVEFDRPSPFAHLVFRTRKPGGARPHRAMSEAAVATAAGRRIQYTVRAMTGFKTEVASTKLWLNVTA